MATYDETLKAAAASLGAAYERATGKPMSGDTAEALRQTFEQLDPAAVVAQMKSYPLQRRLIVETDRVRREAIEHWSSKLGVTPEEWQRVYRAEAVALPDDEGTIRVTVRAALRENVPTD